MFETGKCPMLQSDAIDKYHLSDQFVKNFCDKGCCPDCGKFLQEKLERKGLIQM